ncbi:HAD family hydrolase [Paenibacillus beijingensis]|uniref:HAD family hydrolase n=1 Tax=Paenibacillus beijingensis TaxID=1126833 RepID=A0A0D5NJU0_9BACL|nr:HAD family hydrolase [Paenibacillus beijingensis]AJY75183.1 hypothetical protein VN24_12085 [Paenibacillus beijingensis]
MTIDSSSGKTAVFFDMDDTLYDQLDPFRLAVQSYLKSTGGEHDFSDFADLFKRVRAHSDALWDVYTAGAMTLDEMRIQRVSRAFEELGIPIGAEEASLIQYNYETEQGRIRLDEGAPEYFRLLQQRGYVTGLITNGPVKHQTFKIRALGVDAIFPENRIFISDAVGYTKPDPRIFQYVNEVTGTKPEQSYYVGDSWRNDVAGAAAAGWKMIWLNRRQAAPSPEFKPYRIIGSLSELFDFFPGSGD